MEEESGDRFEVYAALTLAFLAAVLAIIDLGGGKYGDDEIIGTAEKAGAYAWYQSKSIKQGMFEQERELLNSLIRAGSVQPDHLPGIQAHLVELDDEINRYKAEKREILEGSAAVGAEGQVLEKDGQKGQIVGAYEWERTLGVLGESGDTFDLSTLYLQISLVMGTIALVLKAPALRWGFYAAMVGLGALGAFYAWQAFGTAMSV